MTTKTVKRAYKFRFSPTPEQENEFLRTWGCVRVVYNKALEWRHAEWHNHQRNTSYRSSSAKLTEWKKEKDFRFLSEVSSVPLQQCLRHLQSAYVGFYSKRTGYPKFKSKKKSKLSLEYTKSAFRFHDGEIQIAKTSTPLNVSWSRDFDRDSVSTITISRDSADRWFISLLTDSEIEQFNTINQSVGIDLGVKDAVVLDDGRRFNPTDHADMQAKQRKIVRCQKQLSRKKIGSNNRAKARTKLARAFAEYADAKKDWLHKITTMLVENYDIICIEDLNVRGMTSSAKGTVEKPGKNVRQKSGLNRGIIQNNFAEFRELLEYKVDWYGGSVIAIDRFYPSSKTCSDCGKINESLMLKDRKWTCACGAHHDRDINAAKNINAAGLAVYVCGDGIRPAKKPLASGAGNHL